MAERMTGTVKWYNTKKGYGFIGRESGDDIFVHFSSIIMGSHSRLEKGQQVEFTVVQSPKGMQAAAVIVR
jgi:cold shock protein